MAFYQPKASALAEELMDFRRCVRRNDFTAAATHARNAERHIEDYDRFRKRLKRVVDLWEVEEDETA